MSQIDFHGVVPATVVPFRDDYEIDEPELARFSRWLAGQRGIKALMTNGHTGEVFALTPEERARVTRVTVEAVDGLCPVISSIVCEGINEAATHAKLAQEAGASALDVMPPHHWLRFGFRPQHCLDYFKSIFEAAGLPLIAHVYPAWTRASFSSELLAELARQPFVAAFKVGTREMNKYARDIQAIRAVPGNKAILTCHDEYLLASMVQGVDGALVGFASLVPGLIHELLEAVRSNDLKTAIEVQARITPLKDAVYGAGEPTGEAHGRMKAAMARAGLIKSPTIRPPTERPNREQLERIDHALAIAGLSKNQHQLD